MNKITGEFHPLGDKIIVCDMEFGMEKTAGGILLRSDDGKSEGIHPRWARVYAVGKDQKHIKPGDWILLEHGRWSRGIDYVSPDGQELAIRIADKDAILLVSDEKPDGAMRATPVGPGSNFNFNIPGA